MDIFERSKLINQVLAQYHRWFLAYERPITEKGFQNQLDLLSDDIIIESAAGKSQGKEKLKERFDLFREWQNAHHVHNTSVELIENNQATLEADILYQNIRQDKSRYSYTLHYSCLLHISNNKLPLFQKVLIKPTGDGNPDVFEDAYAENRARSFMYYWCYCIETANGSADVFRELLPDNFELHVKSGVADTFEKFNEWLFSITTRVLQSAHYPKNFKAKENEDNTISVTVDFDWQGMSLNNEPMHGETHHEWLLENNMDNRFAKMKKMIVTQTTPFSVINPSNETK